MRKNSRSAEKFPPQVGRSSPKAIIVTTIRGTASAALDAEEIMFKRILVPIDFSPPSDAALEYARSVAGRYGASLHLLHVAEDPYHAFYSAEVFVPEIEGLREEILSD